MTAKGWWPRSTSARAKQTALEADGPASGKSKAMGAGLG
jgi:hypothetical protein